MANVELSGVEKRFGANRIIHGVDLNIEDGEFVVFVGPSGCGKSTLLRLIAGLESISAGELRIQGERVNELPPKDRGVGMVFQSYALYPHMNVFDNMAFGLKLAGGGKEEVRQRVMETAKILQLEELMGRKPKELSGGQRQRVAIGRAMAREPDILLFDEPLSNLDAALRVRMRVEIARLHERLKSTMVYVTHDQIEAMTLADKIVVLSAGRIEQVGSPRELFERPVNKFVAGFIGSPKMNFFEVRLVATGAHTVVEGAGIQRLELPFETGALAVGDSVTLGIRPEHLKLEPAGTDAGFVVGNVEYLGNEAYVYLIANGARASLEEDPPVCRTEVDTGLKRGDRVNLVPDIERIQLFGPDDRALARRENRVDSPARAAL
ncbi:ABC transporter ATP-binding protein [Halotalea alkalilenta]|uniref:ABC transporter ATP-binding protein n=1 Tax=Halotalea alkalilenta TaxID=376489 RepID=UPI00048971D9|nr:sn-glycerol-3-phosphate ABC transporter ATP-binding protein UgpC [Halotalea alkalilenta]